MTAHKSNVAPWLAIAAAVIALDQLTKRLILGEFQFGESRTVTGFFNLVHAHNTGAAFSFLATGTGWQRWFFALLAAAASVFIVWLLRKHGDQRVFAVALSLILGGALGNLIDRLLYGYVVDFLEFHWRFLEPLFYQGRFPAFNVADSAITLGAGLLILDELRRVRKT
ncbi:MAG TPA: signal peptidase II [Burkholderiaceae bacterium]|jgi:signal peptidase II|nr:signal peptidase II [Burkholderiaceae bacterium]